MFYWFVCWQLIYFKEGLPKKIHIRMSLACFIRFVVVSCLSNFHYFVSAFKVRKSTLIILRTVGSGANLRFPRQTALG